MKNRAILGCVPLIIAGSLSAAAVTYSPISCGCVDPWAGIAKDIGRGDLKDSKQLTAKVVADGLKTVLSGKSVDVSDMPIWGGIDSCAVSNSPTRTVRCRWWLWEAPERKKGYDVIVTTNSAKIFRHVIVVPIEWAGPQYRQMSPNNSFKPKPLRGSA